MMCCDRGDGRGAGRVQCRAAGLVVGDVARGDSIREMARTLGETLPRIRRFPRQWGGFLRFGGSTGQVI